MEKAVYNLLFPDHMYRFSSEKVKMDGEEILDQLSIIFRSGITETITEASIRGKKTLEHCLIVPEHGIFACNIVLPSERVSTDLAYHHYKQVPGKLLSDLRDFYSHGKEHRFSFTFQQASLNQEILMFLKKFDCITDFLQNPVVYDPARVN
jgi:hypothetical protein